MKVLTTLFIIFLFATEAYGFASLSKFFSNSMSSNTRRSTPQPKARPAHFALMENYSGECKIANKECLESGSQVIMDLSAQCMCVGSNCFKIAIGTCGPKQTMNGTGVIRGDVSGARYRTMRGPGNPNGYDGDAVRMGIPANDTGAGVPGHITSGTKWIHKTGNCDRAERRRTWGCGGVPCEHWPKVKACIGCSLTVCGGARNRAELWSRPKPWGVYSHCVNMNGEKRSTGISGVELHNLARRAQGLNELNFTRQADGTWQAIE